MITHIFSFSFLFDIKMNIKMIRNKLITFFLSFEFGF